MFIMSLSLSVVNLYSASSRESMMRCNAPVVGRDKEIFQDASETFRGAFSIPEIVWRVRLLGVTIAADLGLNRHVSTVCKTCFFWLRQLRRVRRSLDTESVKTH